MSTLSTCMSVSRGILNLLINGLVAFLEGSAIICDQQLLLPLLLWTSLSKAKALEVALLNVLICSAQ